MKYSERFNRDYNFYLSNLDVFNFCGTLNPKHEAISGGSLSAKECFYYIESQGVNKPCVEPELLDKLLLTKASVNFQIKEWAQGRADGTLPKVELSHRICGDVSPSSVLQWVNNEPVYHRDIETQYNLPSWVIDAVENQMKKYL